MDIEKANAYAGDYLTKLAVDQEMDKWRAERQAQEAVQAAEEYANKPIWEKVYDLGSSAVERVSDSGVFQSIGETVKAGGEFAYNSLSDTVNSVNQLGQDWRNLHSKAADLQKAMRNGDMAQIEASVNGLQQAGTEYTQDIPKVLMAPSRQAVRAFVNAYADNPYSPYHSLSSSLRQSDAYIKFHMTKEERLQKSKEIQDRTGIPAEVTSVDDDAFSAALKVYDYMQKNDDIGKVWEEFPEIKDIADKNPNDAALALYDIKTSRTTKGVIESAAHAWEIGTERLEYNNLQFKIALGQADENDKQRAAYLEKSIESAEKKTAPSILDEPLSAMVAGVAQSAPEMGQGIALGLVLTLATGGLDLVALAGGLALKQVGLGTIRSMLMNEARSEAWKTVAKRTMATGMWGGMGASMYGSHYAELGQYKDKDGNPLFTEAEKRKYAAPQAAVEAGIETASDIFGAGVLKNALMPKKHLERVAQDIIANTTANKTARQQAMEMLGDRGKDWLKMTAAETAEEGLQSVSNDIFTNYALASKGDAASHIQQYSAGDIFHRSIASMLEAIPGAAGFATIGAGGSLVTNTGTMARRIYKEQQIAHAYGENMVQTINGTIMVEQLQDAVASGKLKETAPDVQQKILREQLKDTGYEIAYIDVETALQKDTGVQDLQKVAEAAGMTKEQLDTAMEEKGYISVPVEVLSQVGSTPDLLDSVSFKREAESMARMRMNQKELQDAYQEAMKATLENKKQLIDNLVDQIIPNPTKEQREMLEMAIMNNPANPAQGYKQLKKDLRAELDEILAPALKALQEGMGKAGLMDVEDEQGNTKTIRYTENDEWYRNFYQQFKRKPTKAELEDMAIAMTIGDPSAPQVAGWVVDSLETQQAMEQNKGTIERLTKNLQAVKDIRDAVEPLTGVEMQLTEGLTPEGFRMYHQLYEYLKSVGGATARQARMGAILAARHADIYAAKVTARTGKKYTAADYMRDKIGFSAARAAGGLNQLAGVKANNAPIEQLKMAQEMLDEGIDMEEIYDDTGWLRGADGKWRFEIPDNLDKIHWQAAAEKQNSQASLWEVYDNDRLYEAYPLLETVPVKLMNLPDGTHGQVTGGIYKRIEINKNISDDEKNKTLLHEIQHIIQRREGFAVGGNQEQVRDQIREQIKRDKQKLDSIPHSTELIQADNEMFLAFESGDEETINKAIEKSNAISEKMSQETIDEISRLSYRTQTMENTLAHTDNFSLYSNLAGEQEARRTAVRAERMTELYRARKAYINEAVAFENKLRKQPQDVQDKFAELQTLQDKMETGLTDAEEARYEKLREELDGELLETFDDTNWEKSTVEELEKRLEMPMPHSDNAIIVFDGQEMGLAITNPDLNLDMKVTVLPINPIFNGKDIKELRKKNGPLKKYKENIQWKGYKETIEKLKVYTNKDTYNHVRNTEQGGNADLRKTTTHFELLPHLDEIVKNSFLVEEHPDEKHHNPDVKSMLRLIAPVKINDDVWVVKLTVKQYKDGVRLEADGNDVLYDVSLVHKKEDASNDTSSGRGDNFELPQTAAGQQIPNGAPLSPITFSVRDILKDVKDHNGKNYINLDGTGNFDFVSNKVREVLNQIAWHGSPYDFEIFDLGAIGSGEGAQAHGWGLYFAANREISEAYQKRLSAMGKAEIYYDVNGQRFKEKDFSEDFLPVIDINKYQYETVEKVAARIFDYLERKKIFSNEKEEIISLLKDYIEFRKKLIREQKELLQEYLDVELSPYAKFKRKLGFEGQKNIVEQGYDERIAESEKAIERYKLLLDIVQNDKVKRIKEKSKGKLFKVEIPDNDVLLDEQKTFKEQPEKVQEALRKIAQDIESRGLTDVDDRLDDFVAYLDTYTGKKIYRMLTHMWDESPRDASEYLNKYGIKGITYEGGRDGRCFVVFDDEAIDIIEKFNQAMARRQVYGQTKLMSDGKRIVSLLEGANESTFMHEMAHVFLYDLEELAQIDDISAKELEIVKEWAEWKKGMAAEYKGMDQWEGIFAELEQEIIDAEAAGDYDLADKKKREWMQERFARGFELYLKDGQAPAKGLKAVFRAFKQFLRQLYAAFVSDGGSPSVPVRRVMDRMIATEQEIEAMELEDRYTDVLEAGGEKLYDEKEEDTYLRWDKEADEEAKEKLLKIVMKDLEKEKQADFESELAKERKNYLDLLRQETVYVAEQAALKSGDENIVKYWYPSVEAFREELANTPPMEEALENHMKEFEAALDARIIESHLSEEAVEKAMKTSKYRAKLATLKGKAMAKKLGLINKINSKAEKAMASLEDKLTALPEDTDLKVDKFDDSVKAVMKEINKLRYSAKWSAEDLANIESMINSATKEELQKKLEKFKTRSKQEKITEEEIMRATEGRQETFREMARAAMASKPIHESCYVGYYIQQEKKAARRVRDMLRAKRYDMAVAAQDQQALYSAMVEMAEQNKAEKDKLLAQTYKDLNARSVRLPKDERYWHRQLAYVLRIIKDEPQTPESGVVPLHVMIKNMEGSFDILEGSLNYIQEIASRGEKFQGFQELTMDEFRHAVESMHMIYVVGRDKFKMKTIQGKSLLDVVDEMTTEEGTIASNIDVDTRAVNPDRGGVAYSEMIGNIGDTGHLVAKMGQDYIVSQLKPENILEMIGSAAHRYIYGTLEKAAEAEAKMQAKNLEVLRKIMSVYSREEKQEWNNKVYNLSTEKGDKVSKMQIMCMALNWGTLSNRQRLIGGLAYEDRTPEAVARLTKEVMELFHETMTERDWNVVQQLWDHTNSFWEDTVKVEEELNGLALEKIPSTSFTITSSDGVEMRLAGGYTPVKYEPTKSSRAAEQDINEMATSIMAGNARLGIGRSFTKSRSEFDIYRPLVLDFSVLEEHYTNVIHNATYRLPIRDVLRLVTNLQFENYVADHLGREYHKVLKDWAVDAWKRANPDINTADNILSKGLGGLRRNSTMAIMGFRPWPAIENISNIAIVAEQIGAGNMMGAMADFYSDRPGNMQFVMQHSMFMRNRLENMDRDIRSQPGVFRAGNVLAEFAREHAYDMLVMTDLAVSAPLWLRAYKDAYEPQLDAVKAENEADIAYVIECQQKVDELKAQITDLTTEAGQMDEHLKARRFASPETAEALRQSPFAIHADSNLRALAGENRRRAKELEKERWQAEVALHEAQQIHILTDDEIIAETENRAVFVADRAIRDTFGSGRTIDLPAVQRSTNEITKLLTTFYGFFNCQWNAIFMHYAKAKHLPSTSAIAAWMPFARAVMYRFILTSLIGSTLQYSLGLAGSDDDDKKRKVRNAEGKTEEVEVPSYERFLKVFGKNCISTSVGSMYLTRDIMNVVMDFVINDKNYGLNVGSVASRGPSEFGKMVVLMAKKGEKDAEIQAQQDKREREHQEKLAKLKGKKRQEYLKKWEEDQQYVKPPKRITYTEIAGHGLKSLSSMTAASSGITSTMVNAVTSTMQYLLDTDMRYDPTWKNIIWSAIFDKRPVEREIPKKPPAEPKKKKKKSE